MNNEQYKNLMWHLLYVESMLENVADSNAVGGGLRVSCLPCKNSRLSSVWQSAAPKCAMPEL